MSVCVYVCARMCVCVYVCVCVRVIMSYKGEWINAGKKKESFRREDWKMKCDKIR